MVELSFILEEGERIDGEKYPEAIDLLRRCPGCGSSDRYRSKDRGESRLFMGEKDTILIPCRMTCSLCKRHLFTYGYIMRGMRAMNRFLWERHAQNFSRALERKILFGDSDVE